MGRERQFMSEDRTDNLKKARARLIEQRRAFVKVLAGPYERGKIEQARERLPRSFRANTHTGLSMAASGTLDRDTRALALFALRAGETKEVEMLNSMKSGVAATVATNAQSVRGA
jgi:hypothetical protein